MSRSYTTCACGEKMGTCPPCSAARSVESFNPHVHAAGIFARLERFTPDQRAHVFNALEVRWCWYCGHEQSDDAKHAGCAPSAAGVTVTINLAEEVDAATLARKLERGFAESVRRGGKLRTDYRSYIRNREPPTVPPMRVKLSTPNTTEPL